MRKALLLVFALIYALCVAAQGHNTGMGGTGDDSESLSERLFKIEKRNDKFHVYLNYSSSYRAGDGNEDGNGNGNGWSSGFTGRELRLEILGNITERLSYRLRHQLNKSNVARGEDNFAKATDLMLLDYKFNDRLSVHGGKICLNWGGFEYDENPLYIYQYSDYVYWMDIFMAGAGVSYTPVEGQEFVVQVANTYNDKLADEYGENAVGVGAPALPTGGQVPSGHPLLERGQVIEKSNHPLTCLVNWNGSLFDGRLLTRWAWGIQTLAKHKYGKILSLGQQLTLPRLQWYFDYMGAWEGLDHLRIASMDAAPYLTEMGLENGYLNDVHYHSFITKANWQLVPRWNLMLKGAYEMVSAPKLEMFKNYRKSFLYAASLEYYPIKHQDLRLFLAYIGNKVDYSKRCGLEDYTHNRIELGFMYRMKCF